jgi:[ribosomal protein S18]-alanine N-acetyltransferase
MSGGLILRRAESRDLGAVVALEAAVFSDPWSLASFEPELTDPYAWFTVAERDGELVGYLVARFVAQQGEISNVAVQPAARGQGIGSALVAAAVAAAEREGCEAVWLEVRESNAGAQRLYRTLGFEKIGRRRGYYQAPLEDALVLRREFAAPAEATTKSDRATAHDH